MSTHQRTIMLCCSDRGQHAPIALGQVEMYDDGPRTFGQQGMERGTAPRRRLPEPPPAPPGVTRRQAAADPDGVLRWWSGLVTATSQVRAGECVRIGQASGLVHVWCPRCRRAPEWRPDTLARVATEHGVTGDTWAVLDISR